MKTLIDIASNIGRLLLGCISASRRITKRGTARHWPPAATSCGASCAAPFVLPCTELQNG